MVTDAACVEHHLSSHFFFGRTNVLIAVLQLFKVSEELESLNPPDLNGSKLFFSAKNLNLPQSCG